MLCRYVSAMLEEWFTDFFRTPAVNLGKMVVVLGLGADVDTASDDDEAYLKVLETMSSTIQIFLPRFAAFAVLGLVIVLIILATPAALLVWFVNLTYLHFSGSDYWYSDWESAFQEIKQLE